jgi:hypothetical protein
VFLGGGGYSVLNFVHVVKRKCIERPWMIRSGLWESEGNAIAGLMYCRFAASFISVGVPAGCRRYGL